MKENLDDNHLHKNPNDKISSLEKLTKDNFSKDSTFTARANKNNKTNKKKDPNETYSCDVCSLTFREKSHLATHARKHVVDRKFLCAECGASFKTKSSLYFHLTRHSDTPFKCETCQKEFPERRLLKRHVRVVHTSVNKFPCNRCEKAFNTKQKLNNHYIQHTGQKPLKCMFCPKSFIYKNTYRHHLTSHAERNEIPPEYCPKELQPGIDLRPFKCKICNKAFPIKGALNNHMKTHAAEKPYKCDRCDKAFMKKQSLECHLMVHNGESPQFLCDRCSQSYYNIFALKRHYMKHISEKKFSCEICSKTFWMKDALKVHQKTHEMDNNFPGMELTKDSFQMGHTKPYKCILCDKNFVHRANLKRHLRIHSIDPDNLFNTNESSLTKDQASSINEMIENTQSEEIFNIIDNKLNETCHSKTPEINEPNVVHSSQTLHNDLKNMTLLLNESQLDLSSDYDEIFSTINDQDELDKNNLSEWMNIEISTL